MDNRMNVFKIFLLFLYTLYDLLSSKCTSKTSNEVFASEGGVQENILLGFLLQRDVQVIFINVPLKKGHKYVEQHRKESFICT